MICCHEKPPQLNITAKQTKQVNHNKNTVYGVLRSRFLINSIKKLDKFS